MKRSEGIAYLTNNGESNHLRCFSRYGYTTAECAPVAWRLAYVFDKCTNAGGVTERDLDYAMSLVVNSHEDVAYIIRNYGGRWYGR